MDILENRTIKELVKEFKGSNSNFQFLVELCQVEQRKINDLLFIAKINNLGLCVKEFLIKIKDCAFKSEDSEIYFQINGTSESISFTPMFRHKGSALFLYENKKQKLTDFLPRSLILIDGLYSLGFTDPSPDDNNCVVSSNLLRYENRTLSVNPETIEKEILDLFVSKKYQKKFDAICLDLDLDSKEKTENKKHFKV